MAPIQDKELSPLRLERISQYVPLPPASLNSPVPAICADIFSPLLLSYYPPVKGVVLAYEDVKLSSEPPRAPGATNDEESDGLVLLRQIDEYASPYVWATASLLVWRPQLNAYLSATLTYQAATHITLSHLNTFAITVLAEHLPEGWSWFTNSGDAGRNKKKRGWDGGIADEGGSWVDAEGETIEKGKSIQVRVREWEGGSGKGKGRGVVKVMGSLLTASEERSKGEKRKGKKAVGAAMEVD